MSPIQEVHLPDPRKGSRKFPADEASAARNILDEGGQASDGDLYDKESTARSAGSSLITAVRELEGDSPEPLGVRVVPDGEGFRFAVVVRDATAKDNGDGKVNPDSHTKAELLDLASAEGVDADDSQTKSEIAKAVNDSRGQ